MQSFFRWPWGSRGTSLILSTFQSPFQTSSQKEEALWVIAWSSNANSFLINSMVYAAFLGFGVVSEVLIHRSKVKHHCSFSRNSVTVCLWVMQCSISLLSDQHTQILTWCNQKFRSKLSIHWGSEFFLLRIKFVPETLTCLFLKLKAAGTRLIIVLSLNKSRFFSYINI